VKVGLGLVERIHSGCTVSDLSRLWNVPIKHGNVCVCALSGCVVFAEVKSFVCVCVCVCV